eukprot:CAMPEP_0203818748 /NCGR_PEP_ID=MMETSP0115-20131106/32633_1 /ASSEMBLY_ACC=CAM_ASM_000227 /TAXON_ID=33651 /ORGANISM="Bicosoecid sp, Strain ms1" /LENGTH=182 /DNA_ID=CAMNT_0050727717 /DNA_START=17 /DNA_END=565 /DNA_ORIENTATION=+
MAFTARSLAFLALAAAAVALCGAGGANAAPYHQPARAAGGRRLSAEERGPHGHYCGSETFMVFLETHFRVHIDADAGTFALTVEAPPVYDLPWCQGNTYSYDPSHRRGRLGKVKICLQKLLGMLGGRTPTLEWRNDGAIVASLTGIPVVGEESVELWPCDSDGRRLEAIADATEESCHDEEL